MDRKNFIDLSLRAHFAKQSHRLRRPLSRINLLLLLLPALIGGMLACNLPFTSKPPAMLSPTQIPQVENTPAPMPASTSTSPAPAPALLPETPLAAPPTATPNAVPGLVLPELFLGPYATVLIDSNDMLNIRQAPDPSSIVIDRFPPYAIDIFLTGQQVMVDDQRWVEVIRPSGGTGWVNSYYLTESVSQKDFCADPRLPNLITQLGQALQTGDGKLLASLASPTHGIFISYLRTGNAVNFSPEEAGWVFKSTYPNNWGEHPASGLQVKGAFRDEVLPALLEPFNNRYTTTTCARLTPSGGNYLVQWPSKYTNFHYYAVQKPGSPDIEMDWRTWLFGFEYVNGQPYLVGLNHYFWEP